MLLYENKKKLENWYNNRIIIFYVFVICNIYIYIGVDYNNMILFRINLFQLM